MVILRWTREAEIWLKDIHDYIEKDDRTVADRVVNGIYRKAQLLLKFSKIGHLHKVENGEEIRILLYGHYRITDLIKLDKNIEIGRAHV